MEKSTWIKPLGIAGIVLGVFGIQSYVSLLALLVLDKGGMMQIPEADPLLLRWGWVIAISGILINAAYALFGLFLFLKKDYSLKWFFGVLVLSILLKILPVLFGSGMNTGPLLLFSSHFSNFIRPALDALLFIGLWWISDVYPGDVPREPEWVEIPHSRKQSDPRRLKIASVGGFVLLLIPLSIMAAWIYASGQGGSHAESVALFRSYFPPFLQARGSTEGVSLLFCAAAMTLSLYGNNLRPWYWKVLNITVVVLCGLLFFMNLWSMM